MGFTLDFDPLGNGRSTCSFDSNNNIGFGIRFYISNFKGNKGSFGRSLIQSVSSWRIICFRRHTYPYNYVELNDLIKGHTHILFG